jgi:ATP-dependent exoDNAse (exonuclease V) beta subunit
VVVLPELDVSLKPQPPQVVIDRDEPGGPVTRVCRYVSREVQELLPPTFQKMFEHWPQQAVNESLCLLYVAMTRAVHALHMIIPPPKENENAFPKTYAGILRSALVEPSTTIEPGSVLYEHGTPNWDDAPGDPPPAAAREVIIGEIRLSAKGGSSSQRRGFDHRTPSGMEGGSNVDLKRRLRLDTSDAMRRGSLLHKWFECIEWLDDGPPADAALVAAAAALEWRPADLAAELRHFRQLLEFEEIRKLLSRGPAKSQTRSEVQRERSFVLVDGDAILRGSIDRLVLSWRGDELIGADVIDFKTDHVPNDKAIDDSVEFYRPQLDAYRKAASTITGLDASRVAARIAFVDAGVVRKV